MKPNDTPPDVAAPPANRIRLEERGGHLVAVSDGKVPKLTARQVRGVLESIRGEAVDRARELGEIRLGS